MLPFEIVSPREVKCGPLTWFRDDEPTAIDSRGAEVWRIHQIWPQLHLPGFCVKNYGGGIAKPDDSFSGWRLVSGGPVTRAGQWAVGMRAIRGATPFVLNEYRKTLQERRDEAIAVLASYAAARDILGD